MATQRDRITVQINKDIRSLVEALRYKEETESILVRKALNLGLSLIAIAEKLKLPLPRTDELLEWLRSYGFKPIPSVKGSQRKESDLGDSNITIDLTDLRGRIENLRIDPDWQKLDISTKVLVLLTEQIELLESEGTVQQFSEVESQK